MFYDLSANSCAGVAQLKFVHRMHESRVKVDNGTTIRF